METMTEPMKMINLWCIACGGVTKHRKFRRSAGGISHWQCIVCKRVRGRVTPA